jgi:hypothetical protein
MHMHLTGAGAAFELLNCDADYQFLIKNPAMMCWTGEHARMMAINCFILLLYLVLLPATYVYVLAYRVRKQGLHSERLNALFGFLWLRFEPQTHRRRDSNRTSSRTVLAVASLKASLHVTRPHAVDARMPRSLQVLVGVD